MRKLLVILFALALVSASFGQIPLAGRLSGTYGGYYYIVGNIWVEAGDWATLLPGTTFDFRGPYNFEIRGTLTAQGGVGSDSIRFTTNVAVYPRWRSMRFLGPSSSNSRLAYCVIEWSRSNAGSGGGVYCDQSSPIFSRCTVRRDSAYSGGGGGIWCTNSSPAFDSCTVSGNNADYAGGGIYCENSSTATFTNCLIMCNRAPFGGGVWSADSSTFTNCTITFDTAWTDGGGVYCAGNWPTFENCRITSNRAYNDGGGVYSQNSSARFTNCTMDSNMTGRAGGGVSSVFDYSATFTNCVITRNTASGDGYGGGVHCRSSSASFANCVVDSNRAVMDGGGVYCADAPSPVFAHCTVSGNRAFLGFGDGAYITSSAPTFNSTIISFSGITGVYFFNSQGCQIIYCDIFGFSAANFVNEIDGPPGIGQLVTRNANGDSCDIYRNIFLDPLFVDPPTEDIHLTNNSRCIGAADPNLPTPPDPLLFDFEGDPRPNPPASYPDIGADENPLGTPDMSPVTNLVIRPDFPGTGNMILYWSPATGASYYNVYGAQAPYVVGTLLATGVVGTTWTDINTSSRPSLYFYYVTAVQ
jgi:parallel beta-helix repeat protein